jgi:hypothetical protein
MDGLSRLGPAAIAGEMPEREIEPDLVGFSTHLTPPDCRNSSRPPQSPGSTLLPTMARSEIRSVHYILAAAALGILAACGSPSPQDSAIHSQLAQPTIRASIPTQGPRTASSSILPGLPGVGTTLSAAGHGYSVTLLEVGDWDIRSWALVSDRSRCTADVRQDHFVLARLRIETDDGVSEASGDPGGWLVGPPSDSGLREGDSAFGVALSGWCTKEIPLDEWPVPWLQSLTTVHIESGIPLEGWMVFPVSPEVWESQELVLYYYPQAGSGTGALEWRLLPR